MRGLSVRGQRAGDESCSTCLCPGGFPKRLLSRGFTG